MLIKDSEVALRHGIRDPREEYKERVARWAEEQLKNGLVTERSGVTDALHQAGRKMSTADFEAKLKKMCGPDTFHFMHHPVKPDKKALYHCRPYGNMYLCAYENTPAMPEFSVLIAAPEWIPDPDLPILRARDPETGEIVNTPGITPDVTRKNPQRPGFIEVQKMVGEIRGWRTVLTKIVQAGIVSPEIAERHFGTCDRASWARYGKGNKEALPVH